MGWMREKSQAGYHFLRLIQSWFNQGVGPRLDLTRIESAVFTLILLFCGGVGWICFGVPLWFWLGDTSQLLDLSQLFESGLISVVQFTLYQMFWSTLYSGGLGLITGLVVGKWATQVRSPSVLSGLALPLAVPTLISAWGWSHLLGRSFDLLYTQKAVILAHAFYNIPLVALAVAQARREISPSLINSIRSLGGGAWEVWCVGIWPKVQWPFWSACAQCASFCAMSFALVLILGGGPPVQTLETEIFYRLKFGEYDPVGALSCAFWQFILMLVPSLIVLLAQRRAQSFQDEENHFAPKAEIFSGQNGWDAKLDSPSLRRKLHHFSLQAFLKDVKLNLNFPLFVRVMFQRLQEGRYKAGILLVILFFCLPYFMVFKGSGLQLFTQWSFLQQIGSALKVSLLLSGLTSTFVVLMSVLLILGLKYASVPVWVKRGFSILAGVPSGVSLFILGLGILLAYGHELDPFDGSVLAIVMLQGCLFFPLAFRLLLPSLGYENTRSWCAARSLGASWWEAFIVVDWPKWQSPLMSVWCGVFGAGLGEVGGVSLFGSEKWMTLSLLLSHEMQHYRFEEAQAIAALLLVLSLLTFGLAGYFWKIRRKI